MKHKIPKQENLIYNNTLTTADVLLFLLMVTASLRKSIPMILKKGNLL